MNVSSILSKVCTSGLFFWLCIRPEVIRYSDMNAIVKAERAKIEKFRERDHQHYQESVDELHTHYKEQMDNIQDEAKKQIKDIEGKYMEAFEDRMSEGNGLFSLCALRLYFMGFKPKRFVHLS